MQGYDAPFVRVVSPLLLYKNQTQCGTQAAPHHRFEELHAMNLTAIPIIDHHCHTLRRPGLPLAGDDFRRFFVESTDPRMAQHVQHSIFYMRMVRDVAALFGCDPSEEALLALRAATPPEEYARRLFDAGNFRALL